jgi:hypothetical protein
MECTQTSPNHAVAGLIVEFCPKGIIPCSRSPNPETSELCFSGGFSTVRVDLGEELTL